MSSTRLPGKVLENAAGTTILELLLTRLNACTMLNGVIVATSGDASDDPIAKWCASKNIACVRGSLENVADRFVQALAVSGAPSFVRVCADRPFLDPRIVDRSVAEFISGDFDLVTNVYPATFPKGQTVEVLSSEVFIQNVPEFESPLDSEHVTRYFYRHPAKFKIMNLAAAQDTSIVNMCVDTPEDFARFARALKALGPFAAAATWQEILEIYLQDS